MVNLDRKIGRRHRVHGSPQQISESRFDPQIETVFARKRIARTTAGIGQRIGRGKVQFTAGGLERALIKL